MKTSTLCEADNNSDCRATITTSERHNRVNDWNQFLLPDSNRFHHQSWLRRFQKGCLYHASTKRGLGVQSVWTIEWFHKRFLLENLWTNLMQYIAFDMDWIDWPVRSKHKNYGFNLLAQKGFEQTIQCTKAWSRRSHKATHLATDLDCAPIRKKGKRNSLKGTLYDHDGQLYLCT